MGGIVPPQLGMLVHGRIRSSQQAVKLVIKADDATSNGTGVLVVGESHSGAYVPLVVALRLRITQIVRHSYDVRIRHPANTANAQITLSEVEAAGRLQGKKFHQRLRSRQIADVSRVAQALMPARRQSTR